MHSAKRPVWITREQRDKLAWLHFAVASGSDPERVLDDLLKKWDAAPADATEAVREALLSGLDPEDREHVFGEAADKEVASVLRALGMPNV